MKTKQQELAVLDKAIKSLGPDSYLGPWLSEVRAEVQQLITSDIFPKICLTEATGVIERIMAEARQQAADIVAAANKQSEEIVADAKGSALRINQAAERYRSNVAAAIRQASNLVEDV